MPVLDRPTDADEAVTLLGALEDEVTAAECRLLILKLRARILHERVQPRSRSGGKAPSAAERLHNEIVALNAELDRLGTAWAILNLPRPRADGEPLDEMAPLPRTGSTGLPATRDLPPARSCEPGAGLRPPLPGDRPPPLPFSRGGHDTRRRSRAA